MLAMSQNVETRKNKKEKCGKQQRHVSQHVENNKTKQEQETHAHTHTHPYVAFELLALLSLSASG